MTNFESVGERGEREGGKEGGVKCFGALCVRARARVCVCVCVCLGSSGSTQFSVVYGLLLIFCFCIYVFLKSSVMFNQKVCASV